MNNLVMEKFMLKAKDIKGNWICGNLAYLPHSKDKKNYGYYLSNENFEPYGRQILAETLCRPLEIVDELTRHTLFENDIIELSYEDNGIKKRGFLTLFNSSLYFIYYDEDRLHSFPLDESHFKKDKDALTNILKNSKFLGNRFDMDAIKLLCKPQNDIDDGNSDNDGDDNISDNTPS